MNVCKGSILLKKSVFEGDTQTLRKTDLLESRIRDDLPLGKGSSTP